MIIDDEGRARASGFGALADLIKRLPEELHHVVLEKDDDHSYKRSVERYFAGDSAALDTIPRFQTGTDFQKAVWNAMSQIPYGKTISYKELAETAGNPAAIRAAGTICGLNKLILLVPCHRVVKSDGSVGSYLYGTDIKRSLLEHEAGV